MFSLQYKGRIYRGKFTSRAIRYILSDQAARLFPALQRRWLLPIEALPIEQAARDVLPLPSAPIGAELPEPFRKLGISFPRPVRQTHHVYSVDDVVVTGWAGAMIKDGLLLTERPAAQLGDLAACTSAQDARTARQPGRTSTS